MQQDSAWPAIPDSEAADGAGVPGRGNGAATGTGRVGTSDRGVMQQKMHERIHGPACRLAVEPSRTLMVRSKQRWRNYSGPAQPRRSLLGLPLLSPLSRWVARWDAAMSALDITYTAFLVPVSLGFSATASVDWLVVIDFVASGVYLADVLLCLHIGFVLVSWDGRRAVVTDGPTSLACYARHGYLKWDLPAVLAVVPEIVLVSRGGGNVAWKIFYLLRMLRLLRVNRLARAVWGAALSCGPGGSIFLFELTSAGMYGLTVLWALAVIVNLLGCFWWWLAEVEGISNSWVEGPYVPTQLHFGDLATASAPVRWLYSSYFALSTVTTAVYGDVICTTVPEIVVVMLYDFFSVFWWACIVTLIFEVLQASSRTAHKASVLMDKLFESEEWMQDRLLPGDLQQRVRRYYAETWLPLETGQDEEQLAQLPAALRGEVVWRLAGPTLRASRLLGTLPEELLLFLSASLAPMYVPAGRDVFKQGEEAGGGVFLLQSGEVAVLRGWRQVAAVQAPALLGQAALLGPHTVCTEAQTRLHTAADLAALLADDTALLRQLAKAYLECLELLPSPRGATQHVSSLRRALLELLAGKSIEVPGAPRLQLAEAGPATGNASGAAAPAGQGWHRERPSWEVRASVPQSLQQAEARHWLEEQRLDAAAATAMQEQPVVPLLTE
ncbi:hypothetical protein ABPG77_001419 [Micractinium sp. CCAP 211/92]